MKDYRLSADAGTTRRFSPLGKYFPVLQAVPGKVYRTITPPSVRGRRHRNAFTEHARRSSRLLALHTRSRARKNTVSTSESHGITQSPPCSSVSTTSGPHALKGGAALLISSRLILSIAISEFEEGKEIRIITQRRENLRIGREDTREQWVASLQHPICQRPGYKHR